MSRFFVKSISLLITTLVTLLAIAGITTTHASVELGEPGAIAEPPLMATAPAPPSLVPAILNGEPIQVLYVTRSEDTVLVRCYPGYEPTLTPRSMGSNPASDVPQDGILSCTATES
jgi:hypothetical protein